MKKFVVLFLVFSMIFAMSIPAFAERMKSAHDLDVECIYKAPIVEKDENSFVGGYYTRDISFTKSNDNENIVLKYLIKDKSGRKITSFELTDTGNYLVDNWIVKANGQEINGVKDSNTMLYSGFKADEVEIHLKGLGIEDDRTYKFNISEINVSTGGSAITFDDASKWIENGTKYLLKASFTNFNNAVVKVDINGTETDITSGHDGFGTIEKKLDRYLFQDGKNNCKLIVIADNGERSEYKFTVTAPNSSGGDTGNDDTGNDDTGNDDTGNTGSGILSINFNKSQMFTTSNMILASFMGLLTIIVGIAIGFRVVRFIKDLF